MESPKQEVLTQKCIKEGKAEIRILTEKVFYNPVQEFNRDLSVAVLSVFVEDYRAEKLAKIKKNINNSDTEKDYSQVDVSILEAFSATGLRSIRYAKEVPKLTKIVANDLSESAVHTIEENIIHNGVGDIVETSHDDACMAMYKHKLPLKRFSIIDLDPYGCPSTFLDSAVQSVQNGGLLLITATDMAVLAGNSPETCHCKYGSVSLKTKSCHEMALRILLQCIEQHANRYSRYIVPLMSVSADFYIRVFVKVYTGAIHCKQSTSKMAMVYQCVGCDNMTLQPLGILKTDPSTTKVNQMKYSLPLGPPVGKHCEHCNQKHRLGGPIWSAPIHDESFVTRVLSHVKSNPDLFGTAKRIEGVLSMIREELNDVPLYYVIDNMFSKVHMEIMPMLLMRSAILNAGYKVSFSHARKSSIKTAAPSHLLWDIIRTWAKEHPINPAKLEANPVAKHILSQEIRSSVDLSLRPDANPVSRRDGCLRFQTNPTPNWGPGARNVLNVNGENVSKREKNQNKKNKRHKKNPKREHSPQSEEETRKKSNANKDELSL